MKTSAVNKTQRSVAPRGRKPTQQSGASFADHFDTAATASSPQTSSVSSVLIEGLIGLQEYGDDSSGGKQRQAFQHGEAILDDLELLRRDILLGRVPVTRLRQLTENLRDGAKLQSDPRLRDILEEIDLRAHIELAKLGEDV